jgi:hypothetical protein
MKKSIVRTLVTLTLSAVFSPVALMAQGPIQVSIPFDFTVGNKSFAAGDYVVKEANHDVLMIRSVKSDESIMTLTMPTDASRTTNYPVLTFNRYGNSYFLYKVSSDGKGWRLHQSHREKEMVAKYSPTKPVVVAASLRSK